MMDYFDLLTEPRRPWLDTDRLRQKFLALASEAHPDRVHQSGSAEKEEVTRRYAQLNAAFLCLTEPKARLLHLLELELGSKPKDIQQIPPALADCFADIATQCRNADGFLAEKKQITSPLLQVDLFVRGQDWVEKLNGLQRNLREQREASVQAAQSLDTRWMAADGAARRELLPALEELYRLFGYYNRWERQIQERIVQLSL